MSLRSRLTRFVATHGGGDHTEPADEDVASDPGLASSRATGGDHTELTGDRGSTTGTGRTEEFVGRVAGDDVGYAGETGAERRASVQRESDEQRSREEDMTDDQPDR